jgi:ATP-binding cassette subfamily F protein uup
LKKMNIVNIENLSKSFGEKILFDNITFSVSSKQRIGLIGVNGTGKSTLLKVLAGLESSDSGKVLHSNQFRVQYLPQNPLFQSNTTVLEHVYQGDSPLMTALRKYEEALLQLQEEPQNERFQSRLLNIQQKMDTLNAWEANTQAKVILHRLGITEFDTNILDLSGGQKKRVAMAAALIQPADLLILDEPTNHIDHNTIEWLEDYLSTYKGSLLLVTHDRYFLNRVTNRILELDKGKIYSYEGNYEYFLQKKAEREEMESASEDKRQNLLRRELAWLHRGAKARTTKQKARVNRAEELRDRQVDGPTSKIDIAIGSSRLGKKVIQFEHISKSLDSKNLINDFSYILLPDDRIGIIGPNGSGKSTLLNLLAGRLTPDSGNIEIGQTVKLAYYTQESVEMNPSMRAIDYIKEVAEVIYTTDGKSITASQMLERFLFTPHTQWTPISKLSGGERRRLYLLRILMSEPNVLFLDEPTNDLDTQTLSILEEYLESFPGAVITVSHDRYFLDRTVDHLFAFEGNGTIRRFNGNYSEYLEEHKIELEQQTNHKNDRQETNSKDQSNLKSNYTTNNTEATIPKKLSFKEQKEWDEIESRIATLEGKINQTKLHIQNAGSDLEKVQKYYFEEQSLTDKLEQAMERWTILSELVEAIENNK